MAEIVAQLTNRGVPLVAAAQTPTVTVWRLDTDAEVVTDAGMTHVGRGIWRFSLATSALDYAYQIDADPGATGQVTRTERYHWGTLDGVAIQRVEVELPQIAADVWDVDLSSGYDAGLALAGEQLVAARQWTTNRLDSAPGGPGTLSLYQDDGATVRLTFTLRDFAGNAVVGVAGVPALRGAGT